MSKMQILFICVALLGLTVSAQLPHYFGGKGALRAAGSSLTRRDGALPNITAKYECNSNCTEGCVPASIPQGVCFWVPPAESYVIYQCINDNTQVELKAFGPLSFMCSESDPLHLTFQYAADTCVLPKAGGYTQYHCPS